ncbi:MAG: hypothetical protein HY332_15525 [Chloroflexi bacterium]|nr:hypothetical protein [Chloroflexota bacterium]
MLSAMAVLSITASLALGASVHLKGGKNAKPAYTDNGLTLTAAAALSGLGLENTRITILATANPTGNCTNPGGESKVPGQNPAPVDVAGSQDFTPDQIKNGNLAFTVTTAPPTSPIPGAPDCPNTSWTESITDMAFTTATLKVQQPIPANNADGTPNLTANVILTVPCTLSPATSNGGVPSANVTCS